VELREVKDPAEIKQHSSGVVGVSWDKYTGQWHVAVRVKGKQTHKRFRPKDRTPEEVERARLAAVECQQQLQLRLRAE